MPRRDRILEEWNSYRRGVLPADAPAVQVQELRRAFYSGAVSAFAIYRDIGDDSVSEEEGLQRLTDLQDELNDFPKAVREGRA
jgi:hypothetical protein